MTRHNATVKLDATETFEYVGFWLRVWASLIDTALVAAITLPVLALVYGRRYFLAGSLVHGPADLVISWLLPALAIMVLWHTRRATPGKMAIGAWVVDARTGNAPSVAQCVIRYLGYFVSMLPLFLGIFWVAIDAKKQGWHDKLAGTVVIRRGAHARDPARARTSVPARFGG